MGINNINEVCVAMIVAIFSIAYPIMLDKTYNIGVRYNSENILPLFERERLHQCVKYSIYLSLFSLLLYVLNLKPCFGWDNWLINNSAKLFVLFMTIILTVSIIGWFNLISIYIGDPKKLLKYLIDKYTHGKTTERNFALKAINDIAIYATEKHDSRIEEEVFNFYDIIRKNIPYPDDYYNVMEKIIKWVVKNNCRRLTKLQYAVVEGRVFLLFEKELNERSKRYMEISDYTYERLWRNVLIMKNDEWLMKKFWEYSWFYSDTVGLYGNWVLDEKESIDRHIFNNKGPKRFVEFYYAMGGLMLYCENYKMLKHMLAYTSEDENNLYRPLLPGTMDGIFIWFEWFERNYIPIEGELSLTLDGRYSFFDDDEKKMPTFYICKYISLLFLRQFAIKKSQNYPAPTQQPTLPDSIRELICWENALKKIDFCLKEVINDNALLGHVLNPDVVDKKKDIDGFIEKLKKRLNDKKEEVEEKKKQFRECVRRILTESISVFDEISNKSFEPSDQDEKVCLDDSFKDILVLVFANGSVENFDLSLEGKVTNKLVGQIFDLFRRVSSQKYLLNPSDLEKGIDMVIASNKNAKIIRFDQSKETMNLGKNPKYKKQIVDLSAEQGTGSTLFILEEKDLPYFNFKDYSDDDKMKLLFSDPNSNDDTLVIGLSLDENGELREKSAPNTEDASLVLAAIGFNLEIRFKSSRNIIQIDVNSKEQGSTNKIEDIVPL